MTRLTTLLAFFCVVSTQIYAQIIDEKETLRRIYEQTTILPAGKGFIKNGVMVKNKFLESALKTELAKTPEAAERYQKAKWQNVGYISMLSFGIAAADVGAFVLSEAKDKDERSAMITTMVLGQILMIGSTYKLHQALNNTQNAIWLHNRAQILNEARKHPSLDLTKVAEFYDRNTIQFASTGFYQNGRYQTYGFLNKNLDKAMHNNPLAMGQLKKAKTNKIISIGLNIVGIAALMVSTTKYNSASILDNKCFWGGYGVAIAGSAMAVKSSNQMSKAAWYYNRDAFIGN